MDVMDVRTFEDYKQALRAASRREREDILLDACNDPDITSEQYCLLVAIVDKHVGMS